MWTMFGLELTGGFRYMHIWKFGRVDMHRYGYEILDDTYTQSIVKWVVYGEPEWRLESTRKG